MLNIMVSGCNGKMGKEVVNELNFSKNMLLISGFDFKDTRTNSYPVYNNITQIAETPDVIIDFSFPLCSLEILKYATINKIPIVIATTGFSNEQLKQIETSAKLIPIFQSSNMSFTISLMKKIVSQIACSLPNTDIEIIETHHHNKTDAPSGTALSLANAISSTVPYNTKYIFDRHSKKQKRAKHEIGFSSIRGGNIIGEHTVKFFDAHETFEITHTTYSRTVFAQGSLKAAQFIVHQLPGLYNMENLIEYINTN